MPRNREQLGSRKKHFRLSIVLRLSRRFVVGATAGILFCAAGPAFEGKAIARELYVAVDGSDTNPGTAKRPVATLEKARDLLRSRAAGGQGTRGAVVHVRAGTYLRTALFKLDSQDSGVEGDRVIYRAEGTVRLVGGRVVPGDAFRPVSDPAVKARLPEAAREHVVELDLESLDIKHAGPFPDLFQDNGGIVEFFIDGVRMPLARWPNEGYTTIKRVRRQRQVARHGSPRGNLFVPGRSPDQVAGSRGRRAVAEGILARPVATGDRARGGDRRRSWALSRT